ncbi:head-tail connector protein [Bacillus atrophaeus]|uniref:head-tail connector protein n=1 Tax=Bacillus atrophaeus TaxID=1452 RepID=UPI000B92A673|nr:head-tail connector protein [Bacillus atrophaeus]ASS70113.1 DNA-packaging protein [Bacillus atrophaeus]MCY8915652.1 head-tail connector protein [Bacillus atrophaeus]MCY8924308.1 head-tail connector protein [Bacillus atrophaeus]
MTEAEKIELEKAKKFLRVDGDLEDDLILDFIAAAKEHITSATGLTFPNNSARAALCVKAFVTHWYENREIAGTTSNLDGVLTMMINQLKYTVPEVKPNAE